MKKLIISLLVFLSVNSFAQYSYYTAAKQGLSIREKPDASSKVLEKIGYGQKITILADTSTAVSINTEGFIGYWWKIKYNNKIGYVVSTYLLPAPPPKAGTKSIKEYFAQVSQVAGSKVVVKKGSFNNIEESGYQLTKQLYKNGMEWYETQGYEYGGETYMLPDFTIEQCFLLLRLIPQYLYLIGEKDVFPEKNYKSNKNNTEKTVEVEREDWGGQPGPVKRIKMTFAEGAFTTFEIFILDGQAVISWSAGV